MKKIICIVIIVASIICLSFIGANYFLKINNKLNCDNNICEYDYFADTYILDIKKSDLYYYVLSSDSNEESSGYYYISIIDIFKNKLIDKVKFDTNDIKNISMINYNNKVYTYILGENSFNIYNDLFEKIDNVVVGKDYYGYILPYKDSYLYNYDNKVMSVSNDTIIDEKILYYNSYYINDTPMYLYFDFDNESGYIHILNNSFDKVLVNNMDVNTYENGIYYSKDDRVSLYNIITKENYQSNIEYNKDSIVGKDLISIYEDNKINIYNLKTNIKNYSININSDDIVIFQYMNDNYLFYTLSNSDKLYVSDFTKNDNLNEKVILKDDNYYRNLNTTIVKNIKEKYNVTIKLYDEATKHFPDFYAVPSYDEKKIYESLKIFSSVFSKFSKDFFDKFHVNDKDGINIYVDKSVGSSNLNTQISNPAAYSNELETEYVIAISIENDDLDVLLCHELMHQIENNLDDVSDETFYTISWEKLNPNNYTYEYSYVTTPSDKYTLINGTPYFIDTYSKTFPSEDRARIFERMCSNKYMDDINNNEKILAKAIFIKDKIIRAYPSLKSSELFKYINE